MKYDVCKIFCAGKTADERTINTFGQHVHSGAGVRPQTPTDAPPLAVFNIKSSVVLAAKDMKDDIEMIMIKEKVRDQRNEISIPFKLNGRT